MEKHQDLKREIERLRKLKLVEVVPVVIEAFGSVTRTTDRCIEEHLITNIVGVILLRTARILRKVLGM